MIAPITIEPITARGMSRFGLELSPASWSACSKPSRAKMMPLVETAARMPLAPYGLNPLAAVKLPVWKLAIARTKIVSSGTPTFHQVAVLFVCASESGAFRSTLLRPGASRPLRANFSSVSHVVVAGPTRSATLGGIRTARGPRGFGT